MKFDSPYVGLAPFKEEHWPFFVGRDEERKIIIANLMAKRLTIFYGASGVGKSSVINAGALHGMNELIAHNKEESRTPEFAVVICRDWRDDPLQSLAREVYKSVSAAFEGLDVDIPPLSALPAPHTFSDLLERYSRRMGVELLVILDQFDEYFLYHEYEEGQGTFATEFPGAVNRDDLPVNFLISIREDSVTKLDRFKNSIPNLFGNYLRLDYLDYQAGKAAIKLPLYKYKEIYGDEGQPTDIEDALVEVLLEQVRLGTAGAEEKGKGVAESGGAGFHIVASYLQLVMEQLWKVEREKRSPVIRLDTFTTDLKSASNIVQEYLNDVMRRLERDEQDFMAEAFDRLVSPSGTKFAQKAADLAKYTNANLDWVEALLEKLDDERILQRVAGPPSDPKQTRYEIFHDVLADAVLKWKNEHKAVQQQEEALKTAALAAAEEARQRRMKWLRLGVAMLS